MNRFKVRASLFAVALFCPGMRMQAQAASQPRAVVAAIDPAQRVQITGSVAPQARQAQDLGPVDPRMTMHHMLLQLRRPAEREQALEKRTQQMQTPGNALFHHWLIAEEIGTVYGPDPADILAVTTWLDREGFQLHCVSKNGLLVDFTGSAGQVAQIFSTEMHQLQLNGAKHITSQKEPLVPAALAPVIVGIFTMDNFETRPPKAALAKKSVEAQAAVATPDAETSNPKFHALVPNDLHTIYHFKPAFHAGYTGKGQTIAIAEPVDLPSANDWDTFRTTFGLAGYKHGKLTMTHPGGCSDPGLRPDVPEYELYAAGHAEWASASAPNATIEVASSRGDEVGNGVVKALLGLVDEDVPPSAISISYVRCESAIGPALEATIRYAMQQAASEGISVYSSAGDVGGSACDFATDSYVTETGRSVSAYASSPDVVAVGGTEFTDIFDGIVAKYWRPKDRANYGSAKSYIPEAPMNFSCGSTLLANRFGYAVPYGANGFCNSTTGEGFLDNIASGGGPSTCAYGTAAPTAGGPAVSGTCKGFAKPNYQQGVLGVPTDGVRDLPEVSMVGGDPDTFFLWCFSDPSNPYSAPCSGDPLTWSRGSGTTITVPFLAGVQALVDQAEGAPQGNPNYVFYSLARQEFGAHGNQSCDASLGPEGDPQCVFHDVTVGDNEVA